MTLFVLQIKMKGKVLRVIYCLPGHHVRAHYVADLHEYCIRQSQSGEVLFHVRKVSEMIVSKQSGV